MSDQRQAFPEHFHDRYCFSFIHKGIEIIKIGEKTFYASEGKISLCHPKEVHSNPLAASDIPLSFDTIYISQNTVNQLIKEQSVRFAHIQPYSNLLVEIFNKCKHQILNKDEKLETTLQLFLSKLKRDQKARSPELKELSESWIQLLSYINDHLFEKVTLDVMASKMHMDKFHFSKEFRKRFGMSPMNYVLMKKAFAAKELINATSDLTETAYRFNFSDQAHFSKTFKRYIGVSPRQFKKGLSAIGT